MSEILNSANLSGILQWLLSIFNELLAQYGYVGLGVRMVGAIAAIWLVKKVFSWLITFGLALLLVALAVGYFNIGR